MLGYDAVKNYDLGVIPKMVYLFGTVFKDMVIPRLAQDGTSLNQLVKVPIIYAAKDKALEAVRGDPDKNRRPAVTVPMMSFLHTDMFPDEERKLFSMQKISILDTDHGKFKTEYVPVPMNYTFELYCYAETALDLNNIIEQIMGFFTPEYTARVQLIPTINRTWDIPIVFTGFSLNDGNGQGINTEVADRRMLYCTMRFMVKGWLFGPIVTHPVIKFANVNFYTGDTLSIPQMIGNVAPSDRVTVQPGLLANGSPTTNASLSIPIANIVATDNFGYVTYIAGLLGANTPSGGETYTDESGRT